MHFEVHLCFFFLIHKKKIKKLFSFLFLSLSAERGGAHSRLRSKHPLLWLFCILKWCLLYKQHGAFGIKMYKCYISTNQNAIVVKHEYSHMWLLLHWRHNLTNSRTSRLAARFQLKVRLYLIRASRLFTSKCFQEKPFLRTYKVFLWYIDLFYVKRSREIWFLSSWPL